MLGQNGRIGNCMFQIAATIGYALDYGYDYIFPEWKYRHIYQHPVPYLNQTEYNQIFGNIPTLGEAAFHYSPLIPYDNEQINLFGYFQSKKYWEKHEKTLHHHFELRQGLYPSWVEYLILNEKTCSIHVRHGDYLLPHATKYHGVLPVSYYLNAVEHLYGEKTDDVTFVICSDDIEFCKENFHFKNVIYGDSLTEYRDMYLMAQCKDNIIANSSYSWWSAELNQNKAKRVIAPLNWFNQAPLSTKDLYQPEWIIL